MTIIRTPKASACYRAFAVSRVVWEGIGRFCAIAMKSGTNIRVSKRNTFAKFGVIALRTRALWGPKLPACHNFVKEWMVATRFYEPPSFLEVGYR